MSSDAVIRRPFWTFFSQMPDGGMTLIHDLVVGGIRYRAGIVIEPGQLMGGIDMTKRKGIDLAVYQRPDGVHVLRGFYLPDAS